MASPAQIAKTTADRQLKRTVRNLNAVSKNAVPRAESRAVNKIGRTSQTKAVRETAKKTKVPQKLIRNKARMKKAKARHPEAELTFYRAAIPAIKLGTIKTRLRRRRGKQGGYQSAGLQVGRHKYPNGFVNRVRSNGRWNVLSREGKARYPIKFEKVEIKKPLTEAANNYLQQAYQDEMPKELRQQLDKEFRRFKP